MNTKNYTIRLEKEEDYYDLILGIYKAAENNVEKLMATIVIANVIEQWMRFKSDNERVNIMENVTGFSDLPKLIVEQWPIEILQVLQGYQKKDAPTRFRRLFYSLKAAILSLKEFEYG